MNLIEFIPESFSFFKKGITREQLFKEISSGIIVGIIALPLAIAFAIASGVTPDKGIITAIIAGFIISLLGGSRVQIGGPTGAFIVIVLGIINKYGIEGLTIATFMAGIILIMMGVMKVGSLLKYVPQTLIIGFTSGIALIIFTTQVNDLFGMGIKEMPSEFIHKWLIYFKSIGNVNFWALGIGIFTIIITVISQKFSTKIPGTLIAIIISTLVVYIFKLPVDTIFTNFGTISHSITGPVFFNLDLKTFEKLMLPAFSIAMLGALESLLSAVVADGMIGSKHKPNIELIAQGVANLITPLFGGIPATGAIARTAANIKNGARTPIAGMVHAITLLIIFIAAMPLVKFIPLSCLAGILVLVSWKMSEVHNFISSCKINFYEASVLITTFLLTVFTDLTVAIPVGFLLSTLVFMKRMSDSIDINPLIYSKQEEILFSEEIGEVPETILIFEINGPLFFGSVMEFINIEKNLSIKHEVIILRMRYVPIIDSTGLKRLKEISQELSKSKQRLIISGANSKIRIKLVNFKIIEDKYIFDNIKSALDGAKRYLDQQ